MRFRIADCRLRIADCEFWVLDCGFEKPLVAMRYAKADSARQNAKTPRRQENAESGLEDQELATGE
jgi:hypothetical protein